MATRTTTSFFFLLAFGMFPQRCNALPLHALTYKAGSIREDLSNFKPCSPDPLSKEQFEEKFGKFENPLCKVYFVVDQSVDNQWKEGYPVVGTQLHAAAYWNSVDIIEKLVATGDYDPNSQALEARSWRGYSDWFGHGGATPLVMAALGNNVDAIDMLHRLVGSELDGEKEDQHGYGPVRLAASIGHWKAVESLLTFCSMDGVGCKAETAPTFLLLAAATGNTKLAERMVWCADDFNTPREEDGKTALIIAVEGGYVEIVKELLRQKKKLDITRKTEAGEGILDVALTSGNYQVVNQLLRSDDLSFSLGSEDTWAELTPVSREARKKDVDSRSLWSPLRAAIRGNVELTEFLLKHGADWKKDIHKWDSQAQRLGVRIGTVIGNLDLIDTAKGSLSWEPFNHPSARDEEGCIHDLEDLCGRNLFLLAKESKVVHHLLKWFESGIYRGKALADEGAIHMMRAWEIGNVLVAKTLLSCGYGTRKDLTDAEAIHVTRTQRVMIKAWNRFHWSASICDLDSIEDFMRARRRLVHELPATGEENVDKTPIRIAEENVATCPHYYAAAEIWRNRQFEVVSDVLSFIAGTGQLTLALFLIKNNNNNNNNNQQTPSLQIAGPAVAALLFSVSGWLIVAAHKGLCIGIATGVVGLFLLMGTLATSSSAPLQQKQARFRADKLDGLWRLLDGGLSWLPVVALAIEVGARSGKGLWALLAGVIHAVACNLPPSPYVVPFRVLPAILITVALTYDLTHEHSLSNPYPSPFSTTSASAVLLAATSLGLAVISLPGRSTSTSAGREGASIELTAQDARALSNAAPGASEA